MKIENLGQANSLVKKIRNLDLLLSGKQANCCLSVTNGENDNYTLNEEYSKEIKTVLRKERDRLIIEYHRLDLK